MKFQLLLSTGAAFLSVAAAESKLRSVNESQTPSRSLVVEEDTASRHFAVCGKPQREAIAGNTHADDPKNCVEDYPDGTHAFARSVVRDNSEILNIRCCSDTPVSGLTGKNHGSTYPDCANVWAYSNLDGGNNSCHKGTYDEAVEICEQRGMRLCSFDEVMNACTFASGCNYDNDFVWTTKPESSHAVIVGNVNLERSIEFPGPLVERDGTRQAVRCCGSQSIGGPKENGSTCPGIYGNSEFPHPYEGGAPICYGQAPHLFNFAEAEWVCSKAGQSLCTKQQLYDSCTETSGCNLDLAYTWSSHEVGVTESKHWMVCGDPQKDHADGCKDELGQFHVTYQGNDDDSHEMRCCSDEDIDFWPSMEKTDGCDIYGSSQVPVNGKLDQWRCIDHATYDEAKFLCEEHGARLCTQIEVADGCTIRTGCMHDLDWVWTDTEVKPRTEIEPSTEIHYVACGNPASVTHEGCMTNGVFHNTERFEDAAMHEVRCCSEDPLPWFGLSRTRKHAGCSVYGISELPVVVGGNGYAVKCYEATTHWEAEYICSSHGARLCTDKELARGCARGTGCLYDYEWVWTATPACADDATCEAEKHEDAHVGCFTDLVGDHLLNYKLGQVYSIDSCFSACLEGNYAYAALRNGDECFCGDYPDLTKTESQDHCNAGCKIGEGSKCGGHESVDLFETGAAVSTETYYETQFKGCFSDPNGDLVSAKTASNVVECVELCTAQGKALAALGNADATGGECFCTDTKISSIASDCGTGCASGKGLCGGQVGRSLYKAANKVPLSTLGECKGAISSWWGDPHMVTYDNLKFNCQGIGHFIITECPDFQMQAMFAETPGSNRRASSTIGVAVEATGYPTLEISIAKDYVNEYTTSINSCDVNVIIDGSPVNQTLPMGGEISIELTSNGFEVQYPNGGAYFLAKIRKGRGCLLDVDLCIPEVCVDSAVGLLGTPNGDASDDTMYRNGTIYPRVGETFKNPGGYAYCTSQWCVRDEDDSLFTYAPSKSFSDYDECDSPYPGTIDTSDVDPEILKDCQKTSGNGITLEDCLTEGVIGGREATEEVIEQGLDMGDDDDDDGDDDDDDGDDPNSPYCPDDVKLLAQVGEPYKNFPISIKERDGSSVTLTVGSPLSSSARGDYIYIQYEKDFGASDTCVGEADFDFLFKKELTVQCMHSSPVALIHIFVASASLSINPDNNAEIFPCCHAEAAASLATVHYTFMIACEPQECPTDE